MSKTGINTSIEVLTKTLSALRSCTQPFGCDPSCPFYAEAAAYRLAPMAYCQGRMAGHVKYALEKLQEIQEGQV